MCKSIKNAALISLIFAVACVGQSLAAGEISEISLTPDGRRIAIKSESPMGSYTEQVVPPSRLVIDINGTGVSQLPRISGVARDSSLNIRTAKTASGARVVLDFGNQPVPDHKIVKMGMGKYLLVFLEEATAREEAQAAPRPERPKPRVATAKPAPVHAPRAKSVPAGPAPNASDLSIQSAEIVDGLIVLKLASKTNPAMVYKVDLGVDFRQLGFSTARIAPLHGVAKSSETNLEPAVVRDRKMGPRRLDTNLVAQSAGAEEEPAVLVDDD